MSINRRRAPRLNMQLKTQYATREGRREVGHVINVSQTGLRMVLKGAGPSSTQIEVMLGGVRFEARTVWEVPMGACRVAGIRFENLNTAQRQALRQIVG